MTTPHKPAALAELPVVAQVTGVSIVTLTAMLASNSRVRLHDKLADHAEANRLVADLRDENQRLRALVEKAYEEGFWARETYNDMALNHPSDTWPSSSTLTKLAALKEQS